MSELNIVTKSFANCFTFNKAAPAATGLLSVQLTKLTIDNVCSTADLMLKNIIAPTELLTQFVKLFTNLLCPPKFLLVPFSIR